MKSENTQKESRRDLPRWATIGISLAIHALLPVGLLILPGGFLTKEEPKPIDIVFYREEAPEPVVREEIPEPEPEPIPLPAPEPEPEPARVAEVEPPPPPSEPPPPVPPRPKPRAELPPPKVAVSTPPPPEKKLKQAVRTDLFAAEPEPVPDKPRVERRVARSAGFAEVETTVREPQKRERPVAPAGGFEVASDEPGSAPREKRVVANGRFSDGAMTVTREARTPPREVVTDASFEIASAEAVPRPSKKRERTVVASGGFAGSDAAEPARRQTSSGAVSEGGFGDGVREARPRRREKGDDSLDSQVEIVSKPKPVYTDEARKLRVEGEVVLEVTFVASGEIRVHGVVAGLGHGLDEAAVAAAEKIEFKPAKKNGQPVDYPATLRVVFRLA